MNFNNIINYHIEKKSDITVVCKDFKNTDINLHNFGIMECDENMKMYDFEEKPVEPQSTIASLGIYVIKRALLIELLETIIPQGRYDIVRDILSRYRKSLNIYGYKFEGYWKTLNCIKSYVDINMDFLNPEYVVCL